mmetsp:Transcript_60460/g.187620  ORF Transcript_60460/g.187620 Transcript_60460/m.187620 type:complete len:316 (+) Transcript_60460:1445-2392(+)
MCKGPALLPRLGRLSLGAGLHLGLRLRQDLLLRGQLRTGLLVGLRLRLGGGLRLRLQAGVCICHCLRLRPQLLLHLRQRLQLPPGLHLSPRQRLGVHPQHLVRRAALQALVAGGVRWRRGLKGGRQRPHAAAEDVLVGRRRSRTPWATRGSEERPELHATGDLCRGLVGWDAHLVDDVRDEPAQHRPHHRRRAPAGSRQLRRRRCRRGRRGGPWADGGRDGGGAAAAAGSAACRGARGLDRRVDLLRHGCKPGLLRERPRRQQQLQVEDVREPGLRWDCRRSFRRGRHRHGPRCGGRGRRRPRCAAGAGPGTTPR